MDDSGWIQINIKPDSFNETKDKEVIRGLDSRIRYAF